MPYEKAILAALKKFADAVTAKMTTLTAGEPEDQLRGPFENFVQEVAHALSLKIVCTGETRLPGRLGKPDYAVHASKLLAGYVELKAPGAGAAPQRFTGHNRKQWDRFRAIPNLVYCDGNEWGLYRSGQAVRPVACLSGDVATDGKNAASAKDAQAVLGLLTDFLSWQPIIPTRPGAAGGQLEIDLKGLADLLAPLCRMLRDDVTDALKDSQSPLVQLAKDWRQLLFPDASDVQFADSYAQTVTFALLLARSEGADPLALASAEAALAAEHSLLSRALQVLTDPNAQAEISASLNILIRVIGAVPPAALARPKDPWLYFYEDFMAAYDPNFRKKMGVYYTPVEVARAQVRLIDYLLTNCLGKPLGFADPGVVTLDPAVGTGTYLLAVIDHALSKVEAQQGAGAVPGQATALAGNIYGFEIMVGPYAVSELRVSRALQDKGGNLPAEGLGVYLTDTLESPFVPPRDVPYILQPMANQHKKALALKSNMPVLVCLGNPPYDRHEAADDSNVARTGAWVRWGELGKGTEPILKDFLDPAIAAGHGVHVKNLYNLYVYFWRWALWKVLEWEAADAHGQPLRAKEPRPGVVSFISASSYLDGDAFCGMREHMRRLCDEIWILDLGGEGRGTRKSENVFAIQTPVAIAVAARFGRPRPDVPAKVHYTRIEGTRDEKLNALAATANFASLQWQDCPDDWHAPFRPAGAGAYFNWPLLTDLLPWQHSGVQLKRTWPIAPNEDTLEARWRALLSAKDRSKAFHGTGDREVDGVYRVALTPKPDFKPIAQLPKIAPIPPVVRYAYRSFDRQCIIADGRLMSRPRPDLWAAHGDGQVYLTSLLTKPLGKGPTLTACSFMPDLDHFSGRGAKDIAPLYRDAQGKEANILPGLLDVLAKAYGRAVTPEDFLAYVYGVLAQPAFTERFADELGTRELRVPLTQDAVLFAQVCDVGARLLWLHTYGQRFVPKGHHPGQVPKGAARCTRPVPGDAANYPEKYEYNDATKTLRVGDGKFAPVAPQVYEFEVSGLKVVQSWLGYRMKKPKGKKSSPLDEINPDKWPSEFTTELLELLCVLEATLAEYPAQAKLLSAVVKGPCFKADELPAVPPAARKPPSRPAGSGLFDQPADEQE
ncbi:MAG: N-6 DNA methylase [Planctomycetes bacterium]|nr:N-6 DNA methylase [Planctomycetota bacterium]